MRILITGSRRWSDRYIVESVIHFYTVGMSEHITFVVGDCPTGVDSFISDIAARIPGTSVEEYKADWYEHGKAAGPIRNAAMVASGANVCLAFIFGESRGTRDCIKRAVDAKIKTIVTQLIQP